VRHQAVKDLAVAVVKITKKLRILKVLIREIKKANRFPYWLFLFLNCIENQLRN